MIYVKEDRSSSKEQYYFTDNQTLISKNFTFKKTCEQIKFLNSIGITVESNCFDINHYIIFEK